MSTDLRQHRLHVWAIDVVARHPTGLVRSVPVAQNGGVLRVRKEAWFAAATASSSLPGKEGAMVTSFVPVRLLPERLVEAAAVLGRAAVDDPFFIYIYV